MRKEIKKFFHCAAPVNLSEKSQICLTSAGKEFIRFLRNLKLSRPADSSTTVIITEMKNSQKMNNSFPRPLRDNPFIAETKISSGAKSGGAPALLGFLIFSVWNFLTLLGVSELAQWNLSVLRTLGVASLFTLWLVVTYALLNASKRK